MELSRDQQEFFNSFMDNLNLKYPPRYITGVRKYKSTIHLDYTIEEHIENLEEELLDALAYLHAIRLIRSKENESR